jgi:hypothetical protein
MYKDNIRLVTVLGSINDVETKRSMIVLAFPPRTTGLLQKLVAGSPRVFARRDGLIATSVRGY